jgi:hypothetical protein
MDFFAFQQENGKPSSGGMPPRDTKGRLKNRIGCWGWMDFTPEKNGTSTTGGNE